MKSLILINAIGLVVCMVTAQAQMGNSTAPASGGTVREKATASENKVQRSHDKKINGNVVKTHKNGDKAKIHGGNASTLKASENHVVKMEPSTLPIPTVRPAFNHGDYPENPSLWNLPEEQSSTAAPTAVSATPNHR